MRCVKEVIVMLWVILLFFSSISGISSVTFYLLRSRVIFGLNVQPLLCISLQSFVIFTSEIPCCGLSLGGQMCE